MCMSAYRKVRICEVFDLIASFEYFEYSQINFALINLNSSNGA